MIKIITLNLAQQVRRGLFNIDIIFPGTTLGNISDKRGLAQLGRFDRGFLKPGVFVPMHPHQNDEILSYIRGGEMLHEDSERKKELLNNRHLMLMNAGKGINHSEAVPVDASDVKMLQIFMRPAQNDFEPKVQISNFNEVYSINKWRLVAGYKDLNPPLVLQTKACIYDARLIENNAIDLLNNSEKTYLLHLMKGEIAVDEYNLQEGDSFIYKNESPQLLSKHTADLVLFELEENASYSLNGMYSGL